MTTPYYADAGVTIHHGDCLDVLRELPDASVDAVVTDPPYGLEFMGKEWDSFKTAGRDDLRHVARMDAAPTHERGDPWSSERKSYGSVKKNPRCKVCGLLKWATKPCACESPEWDLRITESMHQFQQWCEVWATECLRVLKPGGHMLAFGGTRTSHRLACAVEDAGFEIRDSIAWLYGSGFPKSLDVSKAIDKAAGVEREVVGRHASPAGNKPGGASLNMSLVGMPETAYITAPATDAARTWQGWGTALKPAHEPIVVARKPLAGTVAANVLAHGTGALNVDGCRVGMSDADLARLTDWHAKYGGTKYADGDTYAKGMGDIQPPHTAGRWPANVVLDESQAAALDAQSGDVAGAVSNGHKGKQGLYEDGLRPLEQHPGYGDTGGASRFFYTAKAASSERVKLDGTAHPTVKPLALMRWLVRLVTPPGGTVLEPFAGSGTTVEACILEGFACIAIEREADYLPLIRQRIHRRRDPVEAVRGSGEDAGLFDLLGGEPA